MTRDEFLALPEGDRAAVVARMRGGPEPMAWAEIASALGVSKRAVSALRPLLPPRLREPLRQRTHGKVPILRGRVFALLDAEPEMASREIAGRLGCSMTSVWYYRRRWRGLRAREELADADRCPVCTFPFEDGNPRAANGWCTWCVLYYTGTDLADWHAAGMPQAWVGAALECADEAAARVRALLKRYGRD